MTDDTVDVLFEDVVLSENCPPLTLTNVIQDWPACQWTVEHLAQTLPDKSFTCKIAPCESDEILLETECFHATATIFDYHAWLCGKARADNPLSPFDRSKFSCYVDYKYMKDFFKECPNMLREVRWEKFGLGDRDGTQSTIWIGSDGAYTPCHYDTYGFNLVAQLVGRKRWYLFPPSQSKVMYPTRLPYEESSVFSEVNIRAPDLITHRNFKNATPYIVTLCPGQVLYVPRHWWHFVECLEPAISVNTWVEMVEDRSIRLEEAITRILFSSLSSLSDAQQQKDVNPYEQLTSPATNLHHLQNALHENLPSDICQGHCQKHHKMLLCPKETSVHTTTADSTTPKSDDSNVKCRLTDDKLDSNLVKFAKSFHNYFVALKKGCEGILASQQTTVKRKLECEEQESTIPLNKAAKTCKKTENQCLHVEDKRDKDNRSCGTNSGDREKTSVTISPKQNDLSSSEQNSICSTTGVGIVESTKEKNTFNDCKDVKITSVERYSFEEYEDYLQNEYDYEVDTDLEDVGAGCQGTVDLQVEDLLKSVLQSSVVKQICQNLLKTVSDKIK